MDPKDTGVLSSKRPSLSSRISSESTGAILANEKWRKSIERKISFYGSVDKV